MFDRPYSVTPIGRRNVNSNGLFDNGGVIEEFLFKFRTDDGEVYHIKVDRYEMDLFMVKFYSKLHENNPFKYNILLNHYKASRVLAICYKVINQFFIRRFEFGSFGFIGAPSLFRDGSMELKRRTKRFRIYSYMVSSFHGLKSFEHFKDDNLSAYLIFRNSSHKERQKELAFRLFAEYYPYSE